MVPYGRWVCADGREFLFNRQYRPILQRAPSQPVAATWFQGWVEGITREDWFWKDPNNPLVNDEALGSVDAVLVEWGLPKLPPRPLGIRSLNYAPHDFTNPWDAVIARRRP
jgi:hypothetical protein